MNNSDAVKFSEMWAAVRVDIYNKPVSKAALDIVFNSLSRFDFEDVHRGIELHINDTENGQFPITPTHVIANIEGRAQERGAVAWRKMIDAVSSVGPYEDVVFDDAAIHSIIHGEGGWVHICEYSEDEMRFFQNRFVKQYSSLVSRRDFDYPQMLKGITNDSNKGSKYEDGSPVNVSPPIVIGNKDQAKSVYRLGTDKKTEIHGLPILNEAAQALLINNKTRLLKSSKRSDNN